MITCYNLKYLESILLSLSLHTLTNICWILKCFLWKFITQTMQSFWDVLIQHSRALSSKIYAQFSTAKYSVWASSGNYKLEDRRMKKNSQFCERLFESPTISLSTTLSDLSLFFSLHRIEQTNFPQCIQSSCMFSSINIIRFAIKLVSNEIHVSDRKHLS